MPSDMLGPIIGGGIGLFLVFCLSSPSLLALYRRIRPGKAARYEPLDGLYEDDDGTAILETQRRFSTLIPRVVALTAATFGFLSAASCAVLITIDSAKGPLIESWLRTASWALLTIQATCISLERQPVQAFGLGAHAALSCLVIIVLLVVANTSLRDYGYADSPTIGLMSTQGGLLVVVLVSSISLERRPAVYIGEKPVDGQSAVSLLRRYTFAWAEPILNYAGKNKKLDLTDLPLLPSGTRAENLERSFHEGKPYRKLWAQLFWKFRWGLIKQAIMTSAVGVFQFGPQFAMLHVLQLLESRPEGVRVATEAYLWVAGLGLSMLVSTFIEAWLFWVIWSELGIPIRELLGTLIFTKATRRKNVQDAPKGKVKKAAAIEASDPQNAVLESSNVEAAVVATNETPTVPENSAVATKDEDKKESKEEEEDSQKSRQSTINLVAIDTGRFSVFTTFTYLYPGAITKMIVSTVFLLNIIGWAPLLAGLAAFSITVPPNIWLAKKFRDSQNRLMKAKDRRLIVLTEALQGIRQIKYSASEKQWEQRIAELREEELRAQRAAFFYDAGLMGCWIASPVLLSAVSLMTYTLMHGGLAPSVAFTTIAVLGQMQMTLAVIPELISDAIEAFVSIRRIQEYLEAPERVECRKFGDRITFSEAKIAWPTDAEDPDPDRFVLRNVSLSFPQNELSVISGKTGSGKSLLLNAILGDIELLGGSIEVPRAPSLDERYDHKATKGSWIIPTAVAYVPQTPWIENATIKDNILFGLPFDMERYQKTLTVCALEKDLEILQDGDMTEVGSTGIGLSGGQRWRVTFARALYSRAGCLILDDIFSAVDAHVGRHLFENALTGELGEGRTRILVTHHVGLVVSRARYMVIMENGTVTSAGSINEMKNSGTLEQILKEDRNEHESEEHTALNPGDTEEEDALKKVTSRAEEAKIDDGGIETKTGTKPKKFVEDEKRETGKIKFHVYLEYVRRSGSYVYWIPLVTLYMIFLLVTLGRTWFVSVWTRSYQTESSPQIHKLQRVILLQAPPSYNQSSMFATQTEDDIWYYLGIYLGLSVGTIIIGVVRFLVTFLASLRASRLMFQKLCYTVLRSPLRWIDTTPTGRILNRFTADFNVIDSYMAPQVGFFLYQFLELIGISLIGCVFVSIYILPLAAVLMCLVVLIAKKYLGGAREIKRLESNAKSPIFEQFGSFLLGISSVRAYSKVPDYISRMWNKVNDHGSSLWHLWLFNRWMGIRLSMLGSVFSTVVAFVIISISGMDAPLAGFTLSFAIQYTGSIIWTIRMYSTLEMNMNAVERVLDFAEMDTEVQGGENVPAAWPTEGRLEVENLVVGYAPDLPSVLNGLSFSVEKGQRIGVVGRTGSGKSTLTLALFRFLGANREGKITIDGIDISKVKLETLRSRLAIIPQDPVLFSGTVRSNLDNFDQYSDSELSDALDRVHLTQTEPNGSTGESSHNSKSESDANINIFESLTSKISEGGLNISQGQRQLLCLARAIVSKPKIMVLDEATSAVDMETDELIQHSIRTEFKSATLLVIAHRLSTIADFDKILVMDAGLAKEFGTPEELLGMEDGIFKGMVENSGEKDRLREIILGKR